MNLFRRAKSNDAEYEARYRELRRTMQDIVIAHAAVAYKHMTPEQFSAVQEEWRKLVQGNGWASLFVDDTLPPTPRWDDTALKGG